MKNTLALSNNKLQATWDVEGDVPGDDNVEKELVVSHSLSSKHLTLSSYLPAHYTF